MSKAVLISIKPKWCRKILNYENMYYDFKRKCALNGKVIGEFVCDAIVEYPYPFSYDKTDCADTLIQLGRLSIDEVWEYGKGKTLYGWHISDLKIYDEPKELSEFGLKRPPQSWCYVEAENA